MGGLAAVSQGGPVDPRLITLRYSGGGSGPTLAFVGKGVTFDTGGISLKPGAGMQEMKFDMSGAAAVLEAFAAIVELGLPVDLLTVVPSTENMPSGTAVKPGDVITQYNGKTVEVNNTDAEGRLILADALAWAIEQGAERVIDLATLTGAVLVALGSTYAAVISNDDALASEISAAGEESGELVWRLPLHPEYKAMMKGTVADLSNLGTKREAGTITAASFLEEFVDGTPWAHIDIAGTAWDVNRAYTGKGGSGYGVRLLVQLVRDLVASAAEDHQGRGAGGEQLAGVLGGDACLRGRLAAAAMDDDALAQHPTGVAGDRAQVLHLEPERGVGDTRGQRRVDGAAECRVENRRGISAVDDADRVVVLLARLAGEDAATVLELDRRHVHRDRDRRPSQFPGDHRAQVVEPRHLGPGGGGRHRVHPLERPRADCLRRRTHRRPLRAGAGAPARRGSPPR